MSQMQVVNMKILQNLKMSVSYLSRPLQLMVEDYLDYFNLF